MAGERRTRLEGSEREPLPGAQRVGDADPNRRVEVTLVLRPRTDASEAAAAARASGRPVSRRTLVTLRGADPADIAAVRGFAASQDLRVGRVSLARRRVAVSGTVAALSTAFGVDLGQWRHDSGEYRGRTGPIRLPAELADRVVAVLGLDDRPQASAHFRIAPDQGSPGERSPAGERPPSGGRAVRARRAGVSFTPVELAALYGFPAADGTGQTIALIELGGGYRQADLDAYFKRLGLSAPQVASVSVDGGSNAPAGSPNSADGEVVLDIEVAGAIAPRASIAVYFAPNTDRGFLDAITAAIHDARRKPSIVSISWGAAESAWTGQAMQAFDQAFQDAVLAGVSVFAAAGDNGSGDGAADGLAHVDFPASSPHLTGCGGTSVTADAAAKAIASERVWNDGPGAGATGGGVSATFPLPEWQAHAGVPASANPGGGSGRGVPDVAGDADPATGYEILVDGTSAVFGGTSAVAPLWAGLTARLNQLRGRPAGFLNSILYASGRAACRDITDGSNGAYSASVGWDACTGLGSPRGSALLQLLSGRPSSGDR